MISTPINNTQSEIKEYIEKTQQIIHAQKQIVDILDAQIDQLFKLQNIRNQIDQTSNNTQNLIIELKKQENELEGISSEQDELIRTLEKAVASEDQVEQDAARLHQQEKTLIQRMSNQIQEIKSGQNTSLNLIQKYFFVLEKQS
ncbi:unnamed protein product [Paramecium pentaurelia]|uniref:Uncharacterized protein n=1 Tax=Paramecium pentaurelia TaxID=43138 RepID=A0A8S1UCE8_9CILI|nr:unnamed protein product [Paramecium pentaurelia]